MTYDESKSTQHIGVVLELAKAALDVVRVNGNIEGEVGDAKIVDLHVEA